jgi:hypothetical protein
MDLFVFQCSQTCSEGQAATYSMNTGDRVAKTYGCPLPESVAEVKNAWSYISTPPYFSLAFTKTALSLLCRLIIIIIIPELTMYISDTESLLLNSAYYPTFTAVI